jgi:hypothetical protein
MDWYDPAHCYSLNFNKIVDTLILVWRICFIISEGPWLEIEISLYRPSFY